MVHFHPNRQCDSCITIDDYANSTVTTHFADELVFGKIVFRHINGELEEKLRSRPLSGSNSNSPATMHS